VQALRDTIRVTIARICSAGFFDIFTASNNWTKIASLIK
jgi:hypothetical protein